MKFGQWLGLLGLLAALVLLWSLRDSLIHLFAAIVLAVALCTLVGWVRQRLGCQRPLALLISLVLVALVLVVVATAVIPPFVGQFSQLLAKLPEAAGELIKLLRGAMVSVGQMLYGRGDGALLWLKDSLQTAPEGLGAGPPVCWAWRAISAAV